MNELIKYATEVVNKHPELQQEINGLIQLCQDNIEEGESETHEIELCMNEIEDLKDLMTPNFFKLSNFSKVRR
jgi:hypothetical protein